MRLQISPQYQLVVAMAAVKADHFSTLAMQELKEETAYRHIWVETTILE